MQQARYYVFTGLSALSFSALAFASGNTAQAAVNLIDLPVNESGAYWQSLSASGQQTLWVGSSEGHIAHSDDGGESWSLTRPTGTTSLAIAQIKALDERQAYVLTQGSGTDSRLYHTRNSGFSWNRVYRANGDETLRCFDLIPDAEAWILGNGLNDNWHVVRSTNGRSWLASRSGFDRSLQPGEGAFNESASCVRYDNDTWAMGSAYGNVARIMVKSTNALRFNVHDTPIRGTTPAVTALYPLGNRDIVLAGGDLDNTDEQPRIYRWQNREFNALPTPDLNGILTNLKVIDGVLVVGNDNGIAWSNNWGDDWHYVDAAATQLTCSRSGGCFSLTEQGIYHFQAGTN